MYLGLITMEINGTFEPGSIYSINNTLGQVIYTNTLDPAVRKSTVDMKGNSPGIYFLTVQSKNNVITKKIILN